MFISSTNSNFCNGRRIMGRFSNSISFPKNSYLFFIQKSIDIGDCVTNSF